MDTDQKETTKEVTKEAITQTTNQNNAYEDIINGFNEFKEHKFSISLFLHRSNLKQAIQGSDLQDDDKKYLLHQMWLSWYFGICYSKKGIEKIRTKLNELLNLNL